MLNMGKDGFSLPELLLSLVLMSVVSVAAIRVTIHVFRTHRTANERVEMDANLRSALAFLRREFRPLNATDAAGGDIIMANETDIIYRSMQGLYAVCGLGPAPELIVRPAIDGSPAIEAHSDSVFVFAEGDAVTGRDATWLRADVVAVHSRGRCTDGSGGDRVRLRGLTNADFAALQHGAPVRNFVTAWLRLYRDSHGSWWLGARQWNAAAGWSRTQPIVGPLAANGVRFTYLDARGGTVKSRDGIRRIRIRLIGATSRARDDRGDPRSVLESDVALRNNAP